MIKVLYVHPSDQPSQLADYYPILSLGVRDAVEYVYIESGDRKSIRFDLGTSEGVDCVDIQHISLPNPEAYYVPPEGTTSIANLRDDIIPLLGPQPGVRRYLVYMPATLNHKAGGLAPRPNDDSFAGPLHQGGDLFAIVFNVRLDPAAPGVRQHAVQEAVHELFHTFGAVQDSAPHYDGNGHCTDEGASLFCKLDARGYRPCPARFVTPRLGFGRHRLTAFAVDAAGNSDPEPAVQRFRILRRHG